MCAAACLEVRVLIIDPKDPKVIKSLGIFTPEELRAMAKRRTPESVVEAQEAAVPGAEQVETVKSE